MTPPLDALAIAASVRQGQCSATDIARAALARIRAKPDLLAVTRILEDRALAEARSSMPQVARGEDPGPLAGVPMASRTCSMSPDCRPQRERPGSNSPSPQPTMPSPSNGCARRARCCATLNMDEFAYGFVTDNACWALPAIPMTPTALPGARPAGRRQSRADC
jgi:aspartyl-tRNA(Asn)/glutamyl-tRNA(Gln) amidotransferase subunit A